ncbi:MAG: PKD domain-containing protein [Gammaproteobacteria bacterium]|nr:PKD domain-containing protein [Gammaproteobacteria bacterium]
MDEFLGKTSVWGVRGIFFVGCLFFSLLIQSKTAFAATICSDQTIPSGQVVVKITPSATCVKTNLSYTTAPIAPGVYACAVGQIPSGYAATTAHVDTGSCYGYYQYQLYTLSNGLLICAIGNNGFAPSGYVVTSIGVNLQTCDIYRQYRIASPTDGMNICATGGVPSGYVVTSAKADQINTICLDSLNFTIRAPANGMKVCAFNGPSGVPSGYVVTSVGVDTALCNIYDFYYLGKLNGTAMFMCSVTAVPSGYTATDYGLATPCLSAVHSYHKLYIAPIVNPPPVGTPIAAFFVPNAGMVNQPVTLDASGSTDPQNGTLSYFWDFGDGVTQTTTMTVVQHVYVRSGTYTVSLVVNNGVVSSAPVSHSIAIKDYSWLIPIINLLLN